jgi:hypothetical protein
LPNRRSEGCLKAAVPSDGNFTFHWAFFRAAASGFETLRELAITWHSTTHFHLIVVTRRSRAAQPKSKQTMAWANPI